MDHPEKVLPYKTYNKIGHLSKSRLGEGDHFIDEKTEKCLTGKLEDQTAVIIVQEKMDGTNVCVVRWKGEIIPLTRSGYRCEHSNQEQHRMFYRYVMKNRYQFECLLPQEEDRVVGEWIALAHGTIYDLGRLEAFFPFDCFLADFQVPFLLTFQRLNLCGFQLPRIVHIGGACSVNRGMKLLKESIGGCIHPISEDPEGLIYRMERPRKSTMIAKYVTHDKVDGKYLFNEGEKKWNWTDNYEKNP